MTLPRRIVVYSYYGDAVYVDGQLAAVVPIQSGGLQASDLARVLGVEYERRSVRYEDMPGGPSYPKPPHRLVDLEARFAALAERQRASRIEMLRAELARLEGEAAADLPASRPVG